MGAELHRSVGESVQPDIPSQATSVKQDRTKVRAVSEVMGAGKVHTQEVLAPGTDENRSISGGLFGWRGSAASEGGFAVSSVYGPSAGVKRKNRKRRQSGIGCVSVFGFVTRTSFSALMKFALLSLIVETAFNHRWQGSQRAHQVSQELVLPIGHHFLIYSQAP